MAGKPSEKTLQAMALVRSGALTPYQAAKQVGLALSTMYRSSLYREWSASQASAQAPARRQQPSEGVRLAVQLLDQGKGTTEAARLAGVSRAALYQSTLYQQWKAKREPPQGAGKG